MIHDPRNSVEKASVVSGRATALPRSIGEEGSNLAPKFVSDVMALIGFDCIHAVDRSGKLE